MPRLLIAALLLIVAGCNAGAGGGPGVVGPATNDPVGAVNRVLRLVQEKRFEDLSSAVCAEKVAAVRAVLDPVSSVMSTLPGVDVHAFRAATAVRFTDLRVLERERQGGSATVAVEGTMTVDLDETRVRELLTPLTEDTGAPAGLVDSILASIDGQAIPIAGRVNIVNQNGTWLVCDAFVG